MRGPRCCSGAPTPPSTGHHSTLHDEEPLWVGQQRRRPAVSVAATRQTSAVGADKSISGQPAVIGGPAGGAGAVLAWVGCLCHPAAGLRLVLPALRCRP